MTFEQLNTFTYLDLVGHSAGIAVVVMGLDDVPVLFASRGGAVSGAATGLENVEGLHHGVRIGAVHGKPKVFSLAGTGTGCFGAVSMVVIMTIGPFLGDRLDVDARRICGSK